MTNLNRNTKINKYIKRALMVVILLAVQFVMFEIYNPKVVEAALSKCCNAEIVNGEYCATCKLWICPGCSYTSQPGYKRKCSICNVWWGESVCTRGAGVCTYNQSRGHYCCTSDNWDNNRNHIAEFSGIHSSHSYDEYVSGTLPTCTTGGTAVYACSHLVNSSKCRAPNETITGEATGHNFIKSDTGKVHTYPTCTTAGKYYKKCADCGTYSTTETWTGEKSDHTSTEHQASEHLKTAGDCVTPNIYYKSCSVCDINLTGTFEGAVGGHDFSSRTNATLKTTGTCQTQYVYYYNCANSGCGKSAKGIDETKTFTNGYGEHSWGSWSVTTAGHCTQAEIETRTCSICSASETRNNGTKSVHNYKTACRCGSIDKICSRGCGAFIYHTDAPRPTLSNTSYGYDGNAKTPISSGTYYTVSNNSKTNAGSYTTTVTIDDSNLHTFGGSSSFTLDWSITKAPITITANNKSKYFGENDPTLTAYASAGKNGQTANLTGSPKRKAGEDVGTYEIDVDNVSLADNGAFLASNYTITARNKGVFTIQQKDISGPNSTSISVTWNTRDVIYDGSAHKPEPTVKYNAPNGTKTLVKDIDYTVSYANNTNVGKATVTITAKGNYGGTDSTTFKIMARELIVTPKSGQSKIYGSANSTYAYDYTGQVSGQIPKFSGALSRVTGEDVGKYNITQGTLALADNGGFKAGNYSLKFTTGVQFEIKTLSIKDITASWNIPEYTYNGDEKKPTITLSYTSGLTGQKVTLTSGTDYLLSYANNINTSEGKSTNLPTVTVTGKGNFTGSFNNYTTGYTASFVIKRKSLSGTAVTITLKSGTAEVTDTTYTYNGDEKKPTVVVKDNSRNVNIINPSDYTVAYSNNIDQGTATVTITGAGNYKDTNTKDFKINKKSISGTTLTLSETTYEYNRDEKKPTVKVYDNERKVYLTEGTDYTKAYSNNIDASTTLPTVTVTGKGNYTSQNTINFVINPKPLSKTTYSLDTTSYIYNGGQNKPTATVKDKDHNVKLVAGTEYQMTYENNIDANANGSGTVRPADPVPKATITGIGNYTGTATLNFRIDAKQISAVWQDKNKFVYNFANQAPTATAATGVTGETAIISTSKNIDPADYISTASISRIDGGRARVANYELLNTTKAYTIYIWPTVPSSIKYIDENGRDVTFIDDAVGPYDISEYPTMTYVVDPATGKKVRAWYNQDLEIKVDGSTLNGTPGGVGYMFHFDVDPNDAKVTESYEYYGSKVTYDLLAESVPNQQYKYDSHTGSTNFSAAGGTNKIYFKSYNTAYQVDDVSGARTESGEISRYIPKIEKTKPTMSITSNKSWSKSHTATITLADVGGSHLLEKTYTLQYSWTQSTATPRTYDHSTTITVGKNVDTATTTITKDTDYGVWYLHVKLTEKLEDNATNYIDGSSVVMYGEFWLDNKAPIVQLEKPHEFVVVDKADVYKIKFEIYDEHVGIDASQLAEEDIEILLEHDTSVSAATKKLTYLSTIPRSGIDVHLYELEITNVAENGYYIMRVNQDRIKDKLGNGNISTLFNNDEIGLTGDNKIPNIALAGPITVKSITEGRNLSGVIDPRYINQEYEITMPIEVTDEGIVDIIDGLQTADIFTYVKETLVDPMVKVTLDKETEVENSVTHVKTFKKEYTLTYSGLRNNGYLSVIFSNSAVSDDTYNKNIATTITPYTMHGETRFDIYVDNITPRIILLNADELKTINQNEEIILDLKVIDEGAGIRGTGPETFEASDIVVQLDGAPVNVARKEIESVGNNFDSVLGGSVAANYTYVLTMQQLAKADGTLRIAIPAGNVIDKANNASEAITLEANIVIDSAGPKLGPITINTDANNQIFGGDIEVKIEGCYDENEIESYEWQRSEDRVNWITIKRETTNSSTSTVIDPAPADGRYYYRVIVTDTIGNSTTSESVYAEYFTAILSIPIIRLDQEPVSAGVVNILGTITSTQKIDRVTVNGMVLDIADLTEKINGYQITTTFTYQATNNGVYTFVATDVEGNQASESINVNLVDGTNAVITAKPLDATIFSEAQIVFTATEPVRIINPNGYPGITFDTSDFTTTIVATISKTTTYDETVTFKFENKALLATYVDVAPPIITTLQYLRFSRVSPSMLGITIKKANMLISKISDAKVLSEGKVTSYYGFTNPVSVNISTTPELNAAINLGIAGKIQIMDSVGKPVELEKSVDDTVTVAANGNFTNGNMSGMYKKSGGTMEPTEGMLEDNSRTYNAFRATIKVK